MQMSCLEGKGGDEVITKITLRYGGEKAMMIEVDKKEDSKLIFLKKECRNSLFWRGLMDEGKCRSG